MAVIRSAVWRVLKGDSTLQGATYLAAAGRIVPGDKAPEQLKNAPRLHIEFLPGAAIVLDDVGSGRVVLRLRSVLQNPSDGVSADDGRHGRISSRAGYLCTGHGVFTDTAYRFMDSWVQSVSDVLTDPKSPEESYQVTTMVARVQKVE
jgi:hypothetical protein